MPYLSEEKLSELVERVVSRLAPQVNTASAPGTAAPAFIPNLRVGNSSGVHDTIDEAAMAARQAHRALRDLPLKLRERMIDTLKVEFRPLVDDFSREVVEETGLGNVGDKIKKNHLVLDKTPGVEDLRPEAWSGDEGLMLEEWAPYGVLGGITPTTNATETLLCNAIGMVAAGNSAVFNVHPRAKNVSVHCVEVINNIFTACGGPPNLINCVFDPTIESAQQLMHHPEINLLVITGGPGVVAEALKSGTKAIGAGPGNPPVVVDDTADLQQAAEGIIKGASLDNNLVCIAEKVIIAQENIADELMERMAASGAYWATGAEIGRLESTILSGEAINRKMIGLDGAVIADHAGLSVDPGCRLLFCEVDSEQHPFVQHEQLMPVIPLVRVPSVEQAIAMGVRIEHGFRHTAVMYSRDIGHLHAMARACDTSIFTKNVPSYAGIGMDGEGYCSYTIASPTGEGITRTRDFARVRRCTLKEHLRIV